MGAMQLDYNKDVCAYFNLQYQFRFQFIDTQLCWSSGISKMSFYVSLQKWVQFLEQWINIKFCMKLGKSSNDTCEMLSKAYGGETMRKSKCFWVV
jgi:hypothetical protein